MLRSFRFPIVLAIALTAVMSTKGQEPQPYLVTISTNNAHSLAHAMEGSGFDVASVAPSKSMIQVVTADPNRIAVFLNTIDAGTDSFSIRDIERSRPYNAMSVNDEQDYMNYDQTVQKMREIAAAHPETVKMFDLAEWLQEEKTLEGRTLWALQISNNPSVVEDEPKIAFVGEHHARELMTPQAVIDTAEDFLQNLNSNEIYARALDHTALWFIPMVNPDGLAYVFDHNRMWRKNRANNQDQSRGVDVNRNYEFKWGECGSNSSAGYSDIYKGKIPHSEPEVRIMDALNKKLRFQYLISYHSSGDEVLYPYLCGHLAEEDVYYELRDHLARETNFGKRPASSSGEDFEHHYNRYGTIAFLLEVGEEFQPPLSEYRENVWPHLQKVLPYLLGEIEQSALSLQVISAEDGAAVTDASIAVDKIQFMENESRTTDSFGRIRWRLAPGRYEVTVSKSGFKTETVQVNVGSEGLAQTVALSRQ